MPISESYFVAISSLLVCKVVQSPLNCLATPPYKEPQDCVGQNEHDKEAYCSDSTKERSAKNNRRKDRGEEQKEGKENMLHSSTSNESRSDEAILDEIDQIIRRTTVGDVDTPLSDEEQEEPEDKTKESPYYYYSVSDRLSRTSKKYRFFYDDATSVSTLESLPSNFHDDATSVSTSVSLPSRYQKDATSRSTSASTKVSLPITFQRYSKSKRDTRKSRLEQLYEYGKQKKRSELEAFQQQKSDSYILRRGGSHGTILYSPSFQRRSRSAVPTKNHSFKNEESSPGSRYIRTSTPLKRNQDVKMKQQRDTANILRQRQEEFFLGPTNTRNRSYSVARGCGSSRTRKYLSTPVQNENRSLTPQPPLFRREHTVLTS